MSVSPVLAAIFREETRRALGFEVSATTVGRDLQVVLATMSLGEARSFVSRLQDAAADYLVATHPASTEPVPVPDDLRDQRDYADLDDDPEPGPAAPSAPAPAPEPASADAVADTPPAEEPSADTA